MDLLTEPMLKDLEKLGFTINESKVYLALLRERSSHAGKVSRLARLDRSSTYNALESLTRKGLVAIMHETKRAIYSAGPPERIIDYFKEKQAIASKVIPSLKEQAEMHTSQSSFLVYKGFRGLKTVFEDILESTKKKEYLVLGSEGQFSKQMPYFVDNFRMRKEQSKINTRIVTRIGKMPEKRGKLTQCESPATINIYGKKVAIFLWGSEPEAIVIENERLSKTMKNYFEIIWKNSDQT
jgi:sugar-specific transcriptional regulator TrmB